MPLLRTSLRRLVCPLVLLAMVALPTAHAEQKVRFGDLEVHYIVFNTTDLDPEMAARYDIDRGETRALVNIAGRRLQADGSTEPVPLELDGTVTNLVGQSRRLDFREVSEPGAVYYLATVIFTDRETLRFALDVRDTETGRSHRLEWQDELWAQ